MKSTETWKDILDSPIKLIRVHRVLALILFSIVAAYYSETALHFVTSLGKELEQRYELDYLYTTSSLIFAALLFVGLIAWNWTRLLGLISIFYRDLILLFLTAFSILIGGLTWKEVPWLSVLMVILGAGCLVAMFANPQSEIRDSLHAHRCGLLNYPREDSNL